MKKYPVEFWTLFGGKCEVICSKHKSLTAAIRAATACEKRSGLRRRIVGVVTVQEGWQPPRMTFNCCHPFKRTEGKACQQSSTLTRPLTRPRKS